MCIHIYIYTPWHYLYRHWELCFCFIMDSQLGRKSPSNLYTRLFSWRKSSSWNLLSPKNKVPTEHPATPKRKINYTRNLAWNLRMMVSKRNLHFQGPYYRFHVKFQGSIQPNFAFVFFQHELHDRTNLPVNFRTNLTIHFEMLLSMS